MFNAVLWTIDNETDSLTFERLCTALMHRHGYKNIIPYGRTRDGGRDAEVRLYRGISGEQNRIFFQYSLEEKWESKLLKELEKVKRYEQRISTFIFVTSRNVSGQKIDKLIRQVKEQYDWDLEIFAREWLRFQLEEVNRDLSKRYLGIPDDLFIEFKDLIKPKISKEQEGIAWKLFIEEKYEEAIPQLRQQFKEDEDDVVVWNAISWCYYSLCNYKEALRAIEKSLLLNSTNVETLLIKGCILAEDGISTVSKAKLVLAKDIFSDLCANRNSWIDYYNIANVLKSLGSYSEAKDKYVEALKLNSNIPEIWTNLGICLHYLGEHEQEIDCFDKAIILNPDLQQALVSKGMTLCKVFKNYDEGLQLIDFALEKNPDLGREFPYIWYWKAQFSIEINNLEEALKNIDCGFQEEPDNFYILEMKSEVLSALWRSNKDFILQAKNFFEFRAEIDSTDFRPYVELASIYEAQNQDDLALSKVIQAFERIFLAEKASNAGFTVSDFHELNLSLDQLIQFLNRINLYLSFRSDSPLSYRLEPFSSKDIIEKLAWLTWGIVFMEVTNFFNDLLNRETCYQEDRFLLIRQLFSKCRLLIEQSLPSLSGAMASDFTEAPQKKKVDLMSEAMLFFPEIVLVELSRQVGYILGINNIDLERDTIDYVDVDLEEWLTEITTIVGKGINYKLKLLRDD